MTEWYPWYPMQHYTATAHLTAEQDGIYRRLIDYYMETRQPLPDNDAALARIAGISPDAWAMAAPIIRPFFQSSKNSLLHHKKCDLELDRQDERIRYQSEKGKKGAQVRWKNKKPNDSNGYSSGNGPAIAPLMPDVSIETETKIKTNKEKIYSEPFRQFWDEYPRGRRGNKDNAYAAWKQALTRAPEAEILAGLKAYCQSEEAKAYPKGAAAWLNDDRWTCGYNAASIFLNKPQAVNPHREVV